MARKVGPIETKLRVDATLWRRIAEAAGRTNQSTNAEIVARLQQSFSWKTEPRGGPGNELWRPKKQSHRLRRHITIQKRNG
jgi:hypothetical protein